MYSAARHLPRHLRIGLLGAIIFAVAFALLWTTAALGALPQASGLLVETFGPNQDAIHFIQGVFWSGMVGSLVFFVFSIAYSFVRSR